MISLKEALRLDKSQILALKDELRAKILAKKEIGAYVEQLTSTDISQSGEGVPIAIKDNIQVKGWNVSSCSRILQGYIAPYDATVITKLKNSGLCPFGRTNMDEFAMGCASDTSYYGKTLNPTDYSRVPGGSSGGSAAAVAAGLAIAALGSDTGGSIRQPAAFCGCVGFKPTYGRVSRYGLGAYSSSLDQIGPITQNVEDAAILYDIIAGEDSHDSTSARVEFTSVADKLNSDKKLNIVMIDNYINEANIEVKEALLKTAKELERNGHTITHRNFSNAKYSIAAYYIIATAEASTNLSRYDGVRYGLRAKDAKSLTQMYLKTRGEGFGAEVQRRMLLGTFVLSSGYYDAYYIKAQKARTYIKKEYEEALNGADAILMPVSPNVAFKFGSMSSSMEAYLSDAYTIGVNLSGLPAITVPVAKNSEGLNISAQLIGKAFDEQTLLDCALSLEKIVKGA